MSVEEGKKAPDFSAQTDGGKAFVDRVKNESPELVPKR